MAWKYIGNNNKEIQYLCISTDDKAIGDLGSRLYESDTGKHYINTNGAADGWVEYKDPALYSAI